MWDEWNETHEEWNESEPDDSQRVTTFWQDVGGDFDGDPMIIIGTYTPDDFTINPDNNFHQFWLDNDGHPITYRGEELTLEESKIKIQQIIDSTLSEWVHTDS